MLKNTKEAAHAIIIDKKGKKCEDPRDILKVNSEWFQDLLTTKAGITEEEREVEELVEIQWKAMKAIAYSQEPRITTTEEVKAVVKNLSTKKERDASSWKNDIIKEGGEEMITSLKRYAIKSMHSNRFPKNGKEWRYWLLTKKEIKN